MRQLLRVARVLSLGALLAATSRARSTAAITTLQSQDELDNLVKQASGGVFIEFFAPWCGHCKKFEPVFEQLARSVASENALQHIVLAKVRGDDGNPIERPVAEQDPHRVLQCDATTHNDIATRFSVRSYPTLNLVSSSKNVTYTGDRSVQDLIGFLRAHSSGIVQLGPGPQAVDAFVSGATSVGRSAAVLYLGRDPEESISRNLLKRVQEISPEVAHQMRVDFTMSHTLHTKFGVGVAIVRAGSATGSDPSWISASEAMQMSPAELARKARVLLTPAVQVYSGREMIRRTLENGFRFALLVFEDVRRLNQAVSTAQAAVENSDMRGEVASVIVPSTEDKVLEAFNVQIPDLPVVAMLDATEGIPHLKKYVWPGTSMSPEELVHFQLQVRSGQAEELRELKSQPQRPEHLQGPLYEVVGSDFHDRVVAIQQDALVMFHAPWCPHCRRFLNDLRLMARMYSEVDSLRFFRIDGTANDVIFPGIGPISSFPTVFLLVNSSTGIRQAIKHSGPVKFEAIEDFLETSVSTPFDLNGRSYGKACSL